MDGCYRSRTPNGAYGGPCDDQSCRVCHPHTSVRKGRLCTTPNGTESWAYDEPAPARSLEVINAENELIRRRREESLRLQMEHNEREEIFTAGCALIGSRIWDGGRTALPTSDIDIFFAVDPARLAPHRPNGKAFVEEVRELHRGLIRIEAYSVRHVDLVGGHWHWALTGREERQCVVLSGKRPEFRPAPANATSAMIRRAALKLMGIKLCIPASDVDDTHILCQEDTIINALRWVQARAARWEDAALGELAGRIDEAIRAGLDVREVL